MAFLSPESDMPTDEKTTPPPPPAPPTTLEILERHIWPLVPPEVLDKPPLTKDQEAAVLGYGPGGF